MRTINGQEIEPSIFFNTFKIKTCIFYLKGKKLHSEKLNINDRVGIEHSRRNFKTKEKNLPLTEKL